MGTSRSIASSTPRTAWRPSRTSARARCEEKTGRARSVDGRRAERCSADGWDKVSSERILERATLGLARVSPCCEMVKSVKQDKRTKKFEKRVRILGPSRGGLRPGTDRDRSHSLRKPRSASRRPSSAGARPKSTASRKRRHQLARMRVTATATAQAAVPTPRPWSRRARPQPNKHPL